MIQRADSNRKTLLALLVVLAGLLVLRYCAFGLSYYPQLDDYIQYCNYRQSTEPFWEMALRVGLLASRPLANIADYFIWSPLFDHMLVGVALVCVLYVACVGMMWSLLRRHFPVGPVFPVVMTLLPLGMEGLYWMSASTRIVGGMFFGCLGAVAFARWLDTGRWYWLAAYLPLQLLPFGFYEQSAVLSMTLVLGLALLELPRRKWRCLGALWAPAAMVLYFAFLSFMASKNPFVSRSELVLPDSPYYWDVFLPQVLGQIKKAFLEGGLLTLGKGFIRGIQILLSHGLWLWLAVMAAGCAGFGYLAWKEDSRKSDRTAVGIRLLAWLVGILLAVVPVTPFLILGNPWFSLRGTVTSFAGIALVADTVAELIFCRWRRVLPWAAAAFALVCSIACLSELSDYRDTYQTDQKIAHAVLSTLKEDQVAGETKVGILNLKSSYLPDQNFYYHEHIHGCTESSWAFSGLITAVGGLGLPSVTPLPTTPMYQQWNYESNRPDRFDLLYYYDGEQLIPAQLEVTGEKSYRVTDRQGNLLGTIWEENGNGYFQPAA